MPNTDSVAVDSPMGVDIDSFGVWGSWLTPWLQNLECTAVMLPHVTSSVQALFPTPSCEPGTQPEVQVKTNISLNMDAQ